MNRIGKIASKVEKYVAILCFLWDFLVTARRGELEIQITPQFLSKCRTITAINSKKKLHDKICPATLNHRAAKLLYGFARRKWRKKYSRKLKIKQFLWKIKRSQMCEKSAWDGRLIIGLIGGTIYFLVKTRFTRCVQDTNYRNQIFGIFRHSITR
jgi:hypothetical protein